MDTQTGIVKSAQRVAALFELLGASKTPLRLTEVATHLDIPKSSAHGLLQTLVATGFVTRSGDNRYRLGIKWLSLAASAMESLSIRQVAHPFMEELCTQMRSTCNLGVLNSHDVIYIDKVQDTTNPIQLVTHIGGSLPAHVTALGKALLAELPPEELTPWLDSHEFVAFTPHTRLTAEALRADLRACAAKGYALDEEESTEGVVCVAACIRNHLGQAVAAISITGFRSRMYAAGLDWMGEEVRKVAQVISERLGGAEAQ